MRQKKISLECFVWWPRSGGTPYLVESLEYASASATAYLLTPLLQAFGERGKPQRVRITVEAIE